MIKEHTSAPSRITSRLRLCIVASSPGVVFSVTPPQSPRRVWRPRCRDLGAANVSSDFRLQSAANKSLKKKTSFSLGVSNTYLLTVASEQRHIEESSSKLLHINGIAVTGCGSAKPVTCLLYDVLTATDLRGPSIFLDSNLRKMRWARRRGKWVDRGGVHAWVGSAWDRLDQDPQPCQAVLRDSS